MQTDPGRVTLDRNNPEAAAEPGTNEKFQFQRCFLLWMRTQDNIQGPDTQQSAKYLKKNILTPI